MLKTTKLATLALAGSLIVGGGILSTNAETAYNNTAVAGISLSVNNYVTSIEDATPVIALEGEAKKVAKLNKTSKKNAKLVMANIENTVNVRKKGAESSKIVGKMYKGDGGKILKKGKYWTKIKSGKVKGWVKNEFLLFGDTAHNYALKVCNKTAKVTTTTLKVRKKKSQNSDVVTLIPEGGKYPVKKRCGKWVKISIDDDCKGYVAADFVDVKVNYGKALTVKEINDINDANNATNTQTEQPSTTTVTKTTTDTVTSTNNNSVSTVKPQRNSSSSSNSSSSNSSSNQKSQFSNDASVSSSSTSTSNGGSQIAKYAQRFIGNPYVYGGTSLTNGTDCSGFTQSVYAHFGKSLPRTAAAQSHSGTEVSLSDLKPGDLIFYERGGEIGHVAMYIGGGSVVHASCPATGIKVSPYNYSKPACARRITG